MFLVGILGYKIGEKIKLNKEFVDSIENYNSNEVSEENKNEQTNEVDENKEIAERYDDNEEHDKQTYEESYLEKEKSIGKVLTKGQGFFRYYSALISTLRSYDINNIDNARVVYRLSDELLNNMYQTFKNDWNKEDFDKLTESQLKWIEKKTKIEEEYKNDDLVRYQTLIEMTLDKCEEWTEYYR